MKKPSFAMVSFLALATLAVGLSAVALLLSYTNISDNSVSFIFSKNSGNKKLEIESNYKEIDTADWIDYTDQIHGVSFKHPQSWQIKTYNKDGFYIIVMEPEKARDHIRVYVTSDDFFAVDGLKLTPTKINKLAAVTANDVLVGIRKQDSFFTFDLGADMELKPQFWGVLKTVAFQN